MPRTSASPFRGTFCGPCDAAHRAIGGISMGGGTALRTAVATPQLFTAVGRHRAVDPLDAAQVAALARSDLRLSLDAGDRDPLRTSARRLADDLRRAGHPATVHVWPGAHDRPYWRRHTADYLRFYTATWTTDARLETS